jgi:hypothetical protein
MHVIVLWGLGTSLILLALSLRRRPHTKIFSVVTGLFLICLGAYLLNSA